MPKYIKEYTREISFPLGGIGTGCIGLDGSGHLKDWEIMNRPAKGSLNGYTHMAIRARWGGRTQVKILQGDYFGSLMGSHTDRMYAGYGFGPDIMTMAGLPHFKYHEFSGEFPLAYIDFFDDDGFPLRLRLTAVSPFIPQNSFDSSLPAAMFRIEAENISDVNVECDIFFSLASPAALSSAGAQINDGTVSDRRVRETFTVNREISFSGCRGVSVFDVSRKKDESGYFDMTLVTDAAGAKIYPYWYRGGWHEDLQSYLTELFEGELRCRDYASPGREDTFTVAVTRSVGAGERTSADFLLTWSCPVCENYWNDGAVDESGVRASWKNWYATVFDTSFDTAVYFMKNKSRLIDSTVRFHDALFSSSLDDAALDAVSANLAVLRSPTVLRLTDGTLYGFEGSMETVGSCEGSCTHVWNYDYALPFLFPDLARGMREADYKYCQFPDGCMCFRLMTPLGCGLGWRMPALDGTMGGIIRLYREWKISGDTDWLRSLWVAAKKALEFAWSESNECRWDADCDGFLEGRQHNTLDAELFGATPWLEGLYLAALDAASEICSALGDADGEKYAAMAESGRNRLENELWNGEYYVQSLDLTDRRVTDSFRCSGYYWNDETGEIKYQIGGGCDIEQLLGQWHSALCGGWDIFDPSRRRRALASIYKYNYKKSFRGFMNPWRNFVLNDEAGTVMFSYPAGEVKPKIPISYCEETMHGFEYQFAGLLISEGMTAEAAGVIRAVRDRYDGKKRNPWSEMECGCNYARSLASFAILPLSAGFTYDMTKKRIGFAPPDSRGEFRFMWSVGGAWGTVDVSDGRCVLAVEGGEIALREIRIADSVLAFENEIFLRSGEKNEIAL